MTSEVVAVDADTAVVRVAVDVRATTPTAPGATCGCCASPPGVRCAVVRGMAASLPDRGDGHPILG